MSINISQEVVLCRDSGSDIFTCTLYADNNEIASADGASRAHAVRRARQKAIHVLANALSKYRVPPDRPEGHRLHGRPRLAPVYDKAKHGDCLIDSLPISYKLKYELLLEGFEYMGQLTDLPLDAWAEVAGITPHDVGHIRSCYMEYLGQNIERLGMALGIED